MSTEDHELMMYHLLSVHAGGPEYITDDECEMVGEADSIWYVSLSKLCGQAHDRIKELEAERDALAARVEHQRYLLREHFGEWEADTGDWDEFDWHDRVAKCLAETPAASLSRLKADVRDEVAGEVEEAIMYADKKYAENPMYPPVNSEMMLEMVADIRESASKLRHQAEGAPNE